ncbi:MAG TPA: hypothetical protein VF519_05325 [Mycobacteriales bacterium]
MARLRLALLAAALTAGAAVPARAADPTVLVAASTDGSLVRVTLTGRTATTEVLVQGSDAGYYAPTQARGDAVSFAFLVEAPRGTRYEVGLLDARTGAARLLTRDGRSGFLLVSPDGRFRYVMRTDADGYPVSLVRTDGAGRNERTLVAKPRTQVAQLSGAGITADGRTIYLARTTPTAPSVLFGVDTVTGATRVVRPSVPMKAIHNVVVSPDGRMLAVSYMDDARGLHVATVDVATGQANELTTYGAQTASAFTTDGTAVVLTAPFLGTGLPAEPGLALGDVASGVVTPILGTADLYQAVPVA